ncbi:MAG: S9 family peptidase [Planctomycetota bacterium]|nr:MAG: S9 family peptidase [Planctomycetota bacterium]
MSRHIALGAFLALWVAASLAAPVRAQQRDDVIAPGSNLVTDGIPPIPESLAERARQYTEFRQASLYSWHPNKREMLIGTRFADTQQVHRVAMPGGERRQITFYVDRVLGASYHPADADYFVLSKDTGGGEFYQLYRYDLAAGQTTLLTDGQSRNTGATWSNSGNLISFGSTKRTGADVDFYTMDPADPTTTKLVCENKGGGWYAADWSPDDKQLLVLEYVSINESYLWLVELASGKKTPLTPKNSDEKVAYRPVAFSKDGKGVYCRTDRDNEFMRLAYIDLSKGKHAYLVSDIPWDVDDAVLSDDGQRIALATNENGVSKLYLFDTKTRQRSAVDGVPTGVIGGLEWHKNNRDLGFTVSSARSPSDVYSLDADSGKIERWTYSETGGLNAESFAEPELVKWKSFDGREISGFLYMPPAKFKGPRPVIVRIHGGPEGQSRPGFMGSYNYFVNELGVALILPNVRGSAGYGKSFLQLDNGFKREGTYKDIGALFDWMQTKDGLDSDRIMVTGGSYGGHMTLAVAVRYNDRIRCSLDVVGISSLVTFLERTQDYRRDLRRVEYGDERDPKMRAFLERIAPLNHADEIKKPLFVVQGKNDPRVPLSESEQIVETLRTNDTPVWYLMAEDEGHGFRKKQNADFQFYATILYIEKYLLDGTGS